MLILTDKIPIKMSRAEEMRYEYKFERIELKSGFWTLKPKMDYHEVIKRHAAEGWRFIQLFAPATSGYGNSSYFELIFERPAR